MFFNTAVLLLTFLHTSTCLRCYVCNSKENPECATEKNLPPSLLYDCAEHPFSWMSDSRFILKPNARSSSYDNSIEWACMRSYCENKDLYIRECIPQNMTMYCQPGEASFVEDCKGICYVCATEGCNGQDTEVPVIINSSWNNSAAASLISLLLFVHLIS